MAGGIIASIPMDIQIAEAALPMVLQLMQLIQTAFEGANHPAAAAVADAVPHLQAAVQAKATP